MRIIEKSYKWNGSLTKRKSTKYIILHHRAGTGDADGIHQTHLKNGWSGIGYHFYIRTNGEIYRGRPLDTVGAHCTGRNAESVGICFEGNYQNNNTMPEAQIKAGCELVGYIKGWYYPQAEIKRHCDFGGTACPGIYFPFDIIKKGAEEMDMEEAKLVLREKVGLEKQTIDFLLCYKYGEDLIKKIAEAVVNK